MAKKKVKKKVSRKIVKKNECCSHGGRMIFMKLSIISFVLFLITVWLGLMRLVHKIHWGWFLGAMIVFCLIGCRKRCCK